MKSEDYKRGVRDMAAAVREACSRHAGYLPDSFSEAEQCLLADPVPKFALGQCVKVAYHEDGVSPMRFPALIELRSSVYQKGRWYYDTTRGCCFQEQQLRALTPLEATGKE